ncbi:CDP-alcohol phosphatidyltransferase [Slackia piriformis]|uniref:CDP-alcohol phosphatidyltransferase n=1 Tax=Slackia piriformis TaxID=626934 RepID=UPI0032C1C7F0
MGVQAEEVLEVGSFDEFANYLRANTRVFMELGDKTYYLTHTDGYWRAQDCSELNDKDHFVDCSELVPTLNELLGLAWLDGKSVEDVFADVKFYKSIQE